MNHPQSEARRLFLKSAAAVSALAAMGGAGAIANAAMLQQRAGATGDRKLKILFLGGTGFLGPHTVRAAMANGHEVTLFNRGRTNADLFPELEKIQGDRNADLDKLKGRDWDCVIDTSAYYPRQVRDAAGILKDRVGQYIMISTISVYASYPTPGMDETSPVGTIEDETIEQVTGATYGPLKALCEEAAEAQMPGRATNIRPGLIVGPGDTTDRFTYWPARVARGGEILAPGDGSNYIQHMDVRDLGAWIIHCAERRIVGVYNADSAMRERTIKGLLDACKTASNSDAKFVYVPLAFLTEQGIRPWQDMPCYAPAEGAFAAFGQVSSAKALANGLKPRPMLDTVRDTLEWWKQQPEERRKTMRAGLTPEREAKALEAWRARDAG